MPVLSASLFVALGGLLAAWWFLLGPNSQNEPYVRDGEAVLIEARNTAASGNCALAATLAMEAAQSFSYGPAFIALGEAYDPINDGSRCLGGNHGSDIAVALSYFGDACEAGEPSGRERIRALKHWVESSAQGGSVNGEPADRLIRQADAALQRCES